MYKKHNLANILTHWFNVAMWLMLLPTGIAIICSPRLGLSPVWMQEAYRNIFGSTANLIRFHYSLGLIWVICAHLQCPVGFRKYFVPLPSRMLLDKDDIEWIKIKPLQMLGFMKDKELPPQDAYNAGQKIYMYIAILGTLGHHAERDRDDLQYHLPTHSEADRPARSLGLGILHCCRA